MYPLNDAEHMEWHVGPRVSGVPAGHTNDTTKLVLKQTEIKKKRKNPGWIHAGFVLLGGEAEVCSARLFWNGDQDRNQ